jgi:hypothetical protein
MFRGLPAGMSDATSKLVAGFHWRSADRPSGGVPQRDFWTVLATLVVVSLLLLALGYAIL